MRKKDKRIDGANAVHGWMLKLSLGGGGDRKGSIRVSYVVIPYLYTFLIFRSRFLLFLLSFSLHTVHARTFAEVAQPIITSILALYKKFTLFIIKKAF